MFIGVNKNNNLFTDVFAILSLTVCWSSQPQLGIVFKLSQMLLEKGDC